MFLRYMGVMYNDHAPVGGVPIALAGPCAGTAGLMRDGRLVQFGELCGVSADVRFAPDFVRFTPNSGRGKHPRGTSQFDPKRKSIGHTQINEC